MGYKLFEYKCTACEHEFEELVDGDEQVACPECQSTEVQKLISPVRANTMNLLSKEDYAKNMRARSAAHTAKDLAKNGMPLQNGKTYGGSY